MSELVEKVALASCDYCLTRGPLGCIRENLPVAVGCVTRAKRIIAAIEQAGFGVRRREPTQAVRLEAAEILDPETPGTFMFVWPKGMPCVVNGIYEISQCVWTQDELARVQAEGRALFEKLHPSASPSGSANEKGER